MLIPPQIILGAKIFAGVLIVSGISFAGYKIWKFHTDAIDAAVNTARIEWALDQREALDRFEDAVRVELNQEKEKLKKELKVSNNKVRDLERMLQIEHDLDRLLQRKPGLVLPRVNKGTEDVLKELEEITQ
jgi:Skp family chaperone for outer membrane proteins